LCQRPGPRRQEGTAAEFNASGGGKRRGFLAGLSEKLVSAPSGAHMCACAFSLVWAGTALTSSGCRRASFGSFGRDSDFDRGETAAGSNRPSRNSLACKQQPFAIKHCHPASAVATALVHRTDEPGPTPSKVASRPGYQDSLFDILPFRLAVTPDAIYQDNGMLLGTYVNIAGRLSAARPPPGKALMVTQSSLALPPI
jgi:hypothetical protein